MNYANGSLHRQMPLASTNRQNAKNVNTVVTPLDMYLALLYPSCPVGIDTHTRKKLRDYATRMMTGNRILKSQRERLEGVLKRLVKEGDKCGLPRKTRGKKYRLPTKAEMVERGYTAAGNSGRFFFKRERKQNPKKYPQKGPKGTSTSPERHTPAKAQPLKRMWLAKIAKYPAIYNIRNKTNNELFSMYTAARQRADLEKLVKRHAPDKRYSFDDRPDTDIHYFHSMAMDGNYSFLQ
jgi:hypothetical protein